MEICKWKKTTRREAGQMVRVSRHEALSIIKSLSEQLLYNNGNSGRAESFTKKGEYFSITVDFGKKEYSVQGNCSI